MAKRKRRDRRPQKRPLRSVIVIASEGKETEKLYFDALNRRFLDANIKQIVRKPTRTEPSQVLQKLLNFKDTQGQTYAPETPYWLVIDTDGRDFSELTDVAREAEKEDCLLAESNPCFEAWLIQHFTSVRAIKGLSGDLVAGGCAKAVEQLRKPSFDPKYNKSRYNVDMYLDRLNDAVSNALADDSQDKDLTLTSAGSRVYKLVESIINSPA